MSEADELRALLAKVDAAREPRREIIHCPNWRPRALWKQVLCVWDAGLYLGHCAKGCYRGELVHWTSDCCGALAQQEKAGADG